MLTKREIETRLRQLESDIAIAEVMDDPPHVGEMKDEALSLEAALASGCYRRELPKLGFLCDACGYRFPRTMMVHEENGDTAMGWSFCSYDCLAKKIKFPSRILGAILY